MARRSTQITLVNNTSLTLSLISNARPCHGIWTAGAGAWQQIPGNAQTSWQTESSGVATGTEGWVKYLIEGGEEAYIYWDNPFVWDNNTNPYYSDVRTTDVTPTCDADVGSGGSGFSGVSGSGTPSHELFLAGATGGGLDPAFRDPVVMLLWPPQDIGFLIATVTGQADINLGFTFGLRTKGSVGETIHHFYDGSKGLRALVNQSGQHSLRKLFRL